MIKLMRLEWKKLKQKSVIGEMICYPLILMFLPVFFIEAVSADFGQSYAAVIELNLFIQMGSILFGASLINQVFIDEYKNKTISLSFSYPFSRQKLFAAKIIFIALLVFLLTMASYLLTGVTTYVIDQIHPIINGDLTRSDIITFFSQMIFRSLIITVNSFIPLFYLGIWKRATVPTVICGVVAMNSHLSQMINLNFNLVLVVLCVVGSLSVFLSIITAENIGEM
ncbi:ABC transporter permease [Gracilibacillus kekensis]|uniref:ABC-2 family transporter protein n=1 Tax=Gracilibacillus kekensis TaxID=1027249 RepID=A0A1M7QH26_9BACI|nr:ABC transporter permease [Gracilibacillus kekensis]SHN30011.1 ABC-2 family transporter protein [Gracilibacillus kekensis]